MKISDFTSALESKYGISIEDTSTRRLTESVDCSTLECKISKILKANGYKADPKYVSAAADYIEMSNEMGDPYTVEQWFKDTEMNYPEDLELEESCKKSLSESADDRPNHMKIIDLIEDGLIEQKSTLKETYESVIGVYNLDRTSKRMWDMVNNHEIQSLFQMEKSSGIQGIALTHPQSVEDLAHLNSVIRLMAQDKDAEQPLQKYARFKDDIRHWYKEMSDAGLTEQDQKILKPYLEGSYGICESQP